MGPIEQIVGGSKLAGAEDVVKAMPSQTSRELSKLHGSKSVVRGGETSLFLSVQDLGPGSAERASFRCISARG